MFLCPLPQTPREVELKIMEGEMNMLYLASVPHACVVHNENSCVDDFVQPGLPGTALPRSALGTPAFPLGILCHFHNILFLLTVLTSDEKFRPIPATHQSRQPF